MPDCNLLAAECEVTRLRLATVRRISDTNYNEVSSESATRDILILLPCITGRTLAEDGSNQSTAIREDST